MNAVMMFAKLYQQAQKHGDAKGKQWTTPQYVAMEMNGLGYIKTDTLTVHALHDRLVYESGHAGELTRLYGTISKGGNK